MSFSAFSQTDSSEKITVGNISIEGNKTTKRFIILRELSFAEGNTINRTDFEKMMEQSRKNLMNSTLFNFVAIETQADAINPALQNVKITVTERWYIWPLPIFDLAEPNFNTWWKGKHFSRTNYGIYVDKQNFRGRKEVIRFKIQLGFSQQIAMQYQIPYINKKQTLGMAVTAGYWGNHEVNYRTFENKRQFLKDNEKYLREEFYSRLTFTYRKELYTTQILELQYIAGKIADTLATRAPDYFSAGGGNNSITQWKYFYLLWQFRHDRRDYKPYPLEGYLYAIDITKYGLGILKNEPDVLTTYFMVTKHHKLANKIYFANGAFMKLNFLNSPSYCFQQGLGYDDYVRGYEYYVIDGQNYGLLRTNLKYRLLKSASENVPMVKNEKFGKFFYSLYLNVFGDAAYVQDKLYFKENPLANTLMYGGGIGLDYVTYYDMVMRFEYSINKMHEPGFYLHFKKSI